MHTLSHTHEHADSHRHKQHTHTLLLERQRYIRHSHTPHAHHLELFTQMCVPSLAALFPLAANSHSLLLFKMGSTIAIPISHLSFIPPPSAICSLLYHIIKLISFGPWPGSSFTYSIIPIR